MGAKPTKEDMEHLASSVGRVRGLSKEDLADCVASLADMAHTGVHTSLPEIRINGQSSEVPSLTHGAVRHKVKSRLERQVTTNEEPSYTEDIQKQLQLLDSLDSQDDSRDWASMRRWLVWCLHSHLDDKEEEEEDVNTKIANPAKTSPSSVTGSRLLKRQRNFEQDAGISNASGRLQFQTQANTSLSLDSDKDSGRSGQNSFDSSGATGET